MIEIEIRLCGVALTPEMECEIRKIYQERVARLAACGSDLRYRENEDKKWVYYVKGKWQE